MSSALDFVHGSVLLVRPPVPATVNKAGANYKSEIPHETYAPRSAFDEWIAICEGIVRFGGDALFSFEAVDEPFLDKGDLAVDPDGAIHPVGSRERLGQLDEVMTGRVFAANGPWVVADERRLRALLPNMLSHRREELPYYRDLLEAIATEASLDLTIEENPHRWEGMADIAAVGDRVVLTYTVAGHYDEGLARKSMRSSREGVAYAADFAGVPEESRIFAELVYPHFHGDTVHFGLRPPETQPKLVHFPGGLYGDGAAQVRAALGEAAIVRIERDDAVEAYAGNSRQVEGGVLVPEGVSPAFLRELTSLGLQTHAVALYELFGKAGGGPACATLYLPRTLQVPARSPLRYSLRRDEVRRHRARVPEKLLVDRGFFEGRTRG